MVSIQKSLIASGIFLGAYAYTGISQHIIPVMLDALPLGNTLEGIIWFGTIITWLLTTTIIPIGLWYYALTEKTGIDNPIFLTTLGILWFVMGLAFTYFTYTWTTGMVSIYDASETNIKIFLTALFWIGIIITWVMNTLVVPTKLIIEAKGG